VLAQHVWGTKAKPLASMADGFAVCAAEKGDLSQMPNSVITGVK
jgi:hypothetical protein